MPPQKKGVAYYRYFFAKLHIAVLQSVCMTSLALMSSAFNSNNRETATLEIEPI